MPINYADPNAFNPSAQRDAITQALMDVASPPPRTQMPGTQAPLNPARDQLGSQLLPPTAGSVGGMNANPGGMPGQFNPMAAATPPAAGPMPPSSGAPGAGLGLPGGLPGAIPGAGGPRPGVPGQVMPPAPGAPTAPGSIDIQQLLGQTLQQPTPGTQIPNRGY